MTIILFSGKAEAGKTTAANILKEILEKNNKKVLITHYGDLLKYICKTFFGWNGEKDLKGRSLLQHVGTEGIRSQNPDYWINFTKSIVDLFPNEWDYILIPDCRFINEMEVFDNNHNVIKVRINRPNYENKLTPEQRNHPSETLLDNYNKFDYIIENDKFGLNFFEELIEKFYFNSILNFAA